MVKVYFINQVWSSKRWNTASPNIVLKDVYKQKYCDVRVHPPLLDSLLVSKCGLKYHVKWFEKGVLHVKRSYEAWDMIVSVYEFFLKSFFVGLLSFAWLNIFIIATLIYYSINRFTNTHTIMICLTPQGLICPYKLCYLHTKVNIRFLHQHKS